MNALTEAGYAAESYSFCAIEPSGGIVEPPDPHLAKLAGIAKPQEVIPAVSGFVEIAELVACASEGEDPGNKFLANIRATDAIGHAMHCLDDPNAVRFIGEADFDGQPPAITISDLALPRLSHTTHHTAFERLWANG